MLVILGQIKIYYKNLFHLFLYFFNVATRKIDYTCGMNYPSSGQCG